MNIAGEENFSGVSLSDPAALKEVLTALEEGNSFLLCSHIRSDADSIGSELGLGYLLEAMDRDVDIANHGGIDRHLNWMPGADQIHSGTDDLNKEYDTVISLDCANRNRLASINDAIPEDATLINLDHHRTNKNFGDINWIEPTFSSVGEMIFVLWEHMEHELHKDAATCIYTAVVSDTGQFSFPHTSARSHEVAASLLKTGVKPYEVNKYLYQNLEESELKLMGYVIQNIRRAVSGELAWAEMDHQTYEDCGTEPWESQPFIQLIMQLSGVEVGLLLRELVSPMVGGGSETRIKGSLRSRGTYDVSQIAGLFGGGGHSQAAGFMVEEADSMEEARELVIDKIIEAMENSDFKKQD